MKVVIFLRKNLPINRFRDLLISSIGSGKGNRVLLCSGFFQENYKSSSYRATLEPRFIDALVKNKISLTTVGIHNNTWLPSYKAFITNLKKAKVNVFAKHLSALKWHAKVFILFKDDTPLFGIIGSSNITRRAFSTEKDFNYECDVVLATNKMQAELNLFTDTINDPSEIIISDYNIEENKGITIEDRLMDLEKEIMSIRNMKNLE